MHLPKREVHFLMIKVRSIEGRLITADGYTELLKAVKDELEELKEFNPAVNFLTHTSAIIHIDEIPEEPEEAWADRSCCECSIYDWGKGCPYREGHVTLMMPACSHFTVEYQEV